MEAGEREDRLQEEVSYLREENALLRGDLAEIRTLYEQVGGNGWEEEAGRLADEVGRLAE
jgi:hypothetical protein